MNIWPPLWMIAGVVSWETGKALGRAIVRRQTPPVEPPQVAVTVSTLSPHEFFTRLLGLGIDVVCECGHPASQHAWGATNECRDCEDCWKFAPALRQEQQ